MSAPLEAELAAELEALRARSRLRALRPPAGRDFCSNDYLGLARHPRLRSALRAFLDGEENPLAGTSSRLVRGEHAAFAALERRFAAWLGREAALFFSSGYAANLGLVTALARRGDVIFSDQLNHASLIDGIRLSGADRARVAHGDLGAWERAFAAHPPLPGRRRIAVLESIHSMEGDVAPLVELAALCDRHQVELIVDEAHATGLAGPRGEGCVAAAGLGGRVLATVHTCGKSLAAAGALVAGSSVLREYLVNRARSFIFATAPPPWLAAQASAALDLMLAEPWRRERAPALAARLRDRLRRAGVPAAGQAPAAIVPVILGNDARAVAVAGSLAAAGFDVRAIRPPTVPEGQARLRVALHADQTERDVDEFAAALESALA